MRLHVDLESSATKLSSLKRKSLKKDQDARA